MDRLLIFERFQFWRFTTSSDRKSTELSIIEEFCFASCEKWIVFQLEKVIQLHSIIFDMRKIKVFFSINCSICRSRKFISLLVSSLFTSLSFDHCHLDLIDNYFLWRRQLSYKLSPRPFPPMMTTLSFSLSSHWTLVPSKDLSISILISKMLINALLLFWRDYRITRLFFWSMIPSVGCLKWFSSAIIWLFLVLDFQCTRRSFQQPARSMIWSSSIEISNR